MDLGEIQRASLGPYLWKKKIATYHENDVLRGGDQSELLRPTSRHLYGDPMDWSGHFLVPGGRFLVSAMSSMTLSVWDLGVIGRSAAHPRLVAEVELVGGEDEGYDENEFGVSISDICVQKISDDRLRIAVITSPQILIAKVYEISPADEDADFKALGSFRLSALGIEAIWGLLIDGDRLLIGVEEFHVMLWEYVTGRYIIWKIGNLGNDPEISIVGNLILHLSDNGITTWPIPALDALIPLTSSISAFDDLPTQAPADLRVVPFGCVLPSGCRISFLLPSTCFDKDTTAHRYMISVGPVDPTQVKVTWLTSLTLVAKEKKLFTIDGTGSLETSHLGAAVLRTYQSGNGSRRRPTEQHRTHIHSVISGPLADRDTQRNSPSPMFGLAIAQLTPIYNQMPVSISLCTSSGRAVELVRHALPGSARCDFNVTDYL
ncbi:hypothetical protein EST38_g5629 [Candolleomyces aberdarensis]|uniref:Uncharacterized protein n=1 Tax=Candolleomyces aberdarensis TaxID=2316362 RepID=A0A4Q2DLZ8_9AGAR|nr:hypothetical protein EST38_g5629 [Candolleomyces aberdarensis]